MNRTITIRLLLIGLALALLAGLLLLVSFQAAASNTTTRHSAYNARMGTFAVGPNEKMHLYVWIEEKDRLSTGLRDSLMSGLRADGRFEPVLLPTPKPSSKDFPILRVWIERPGYSWTPVYAQADMQVRWAFSSFNTDVSFEDNAFMLNNVTGPSLAARGTINLRDRTTGLISLPGYWDHLAQEAAKAVQDELTGQVDP